MLIAEQVYHFCRRQFRRLYAERIAGPLRADGLRRMPRNARASYYIGLAVGLEERLAEERRQSARTTPLTRRSCPASESTRNW